MGLFHVRKFLRVGQTLALAGISYFSKYFRP